MLKHGEVNPLVVFGLRRLDHCPPHFTRVEFNIRCDEKNISDWIWANLSGRFYLGDVYKTTEAGSIALNKCVAFELGSEASFFGLILDTVNVAEVW